MEAKDLLAILAPLIALVVAIATIAFNAYDRRRSHIIEREKLQLERKKLSQEIARALLANSKSFEKRSDVYNTILSHVSGVTNSFRGIEFELKTHSKPRWSHASVVAQLDQVQAILQANQIFTTRYVHETIMRPYLLEIYKYSEGIDAIVANRAGKQAETEAILNLCTQAMAASDAVKADIREDLENFVRNLSREATDIHNLGAE